MVLDRSQVSRPTEQNVATCYARRDRNCFLNAARRTFTRISAPRDRYCAHSSAIARDRSKDLKERKNPAVVIDGQTVSIRGVILSNHPRIIEAPLVSEEKCVSLYINRVIHSFLAAQLLISERFAKQAFRINAMSNR